MKLWGVRKVMLQGVGCWNLGRFQGLWCWEFRRRWSWVTTVDFKVIGGKCWVDLAVEWRGSFAGSWVDLGDGFGVICWAVKALD